MHADSKEDKSLLRGDQSEEGPQKQTSHDSYRLNGKRRTSWSKHLDHNRGRGQSKAGTEDDRDGQ
jgi:hypothetical protein